MKFLSKKARWENLFICIYAIKFVDGREMPVVDEFSRFRETFINIRVHYICTYIFH